MVMTTISADVTAQMVKWADCQVKKGIYKSKSELVREMFREKMLKNTFPQMALSQKVLEKIWDNEEDEVWEKYL